MANSLKTIGATYGSRSRLFRLKSDVPAEKPDVSQQAKAENKQLLSLIR